MQKGTALNYEYLLRLKQTHTTWRLLHADNAPLILSFFYRIFIVSNRRHYPYTELISKLDDYLHQLRRDYGETLYPKSAKAYIEDWCHNDNSYLRKYYPQYGDEPECDLTPATEKAIDWIQSLEQREFVGTESRLFHLFELLKDIVHKTETNVELRLTELETQKQALEAQIHKIKTEGVVDVYDPRQIKERFMQAEETARRLLSDFRQVEYNFRELDRNARERITLSDKQKGALLDEIFTEQDVIRDSDQGKSFKAFWEFLMAPQRQAELTQLLNDLFALEEIAKLNPDQLLARIPVYLLDAGEKVYRTGNLLSEQLRRYLDDQAYLANKRLMELINEIEKETIGHKEKIPLQGKFMELTHFKVHLDSFMSSTLFTPPKKIKLTTGKLKAGTEDGAINVLFEQVYVDEALLASRIQKALQGVSQIRLKDLLTEFPVEKGLSEIVVYLKLATQSERSIIDETEEETLIVNDKSILLPQVIFVR